MKKNLISKKSKKGHKNEAMQGYIQIYTGNGKGKTTAALGLALRAAGYGFRSYIGQFLKGQSYGELSSLIKLQPLITIEQFGRKGFIHVTKNPDAEDIKRAKHGLKKCLEAMLSGQFKIIILDEINVAVYFNLLTEKEVLEFMAKKPKEVELVLTGRYAPPAFMEKADLVTEMKEIKHYYQQGVKARLGIEK